MNFFCHAAFTGDEQNTFMGVGKKKVSVGVRPFLMHITHVSSDIYLKVVQSVAVFKGDLNELFI